MLVRGVAAGPGTGGHRVHRVSHLQHLCPQIMSRSQYRWIGAQYGQAAASMALSVRSSAFFTDLAPARLRARARPHPGLMRGRVAGMRA